jgi:hypothetical protein
MTNDKWGKAKNHVPKPTAPASKPGRKMLDKLRSVWYNVHCVNRMFI